MFDSRDETREHPAALSVSDAMALAKGALEGVTVRLVGEVSEVSDKPGYKAVYFTVKDSSASLPCMMWNNRYRSSGVKLRVGMLVELAGRFTLYAAKGRMNFDVFSVSLAGEGNLRLQVANLAKRIEAEGLMDPARKRKLPAWPETIGIVTSPRGDAIHDMLRTLRRRYPLAKVVIAGVPVEGADAPLSMVEGLRALVSAGVQMILLGRGGGSFEDLMPFNDERLVRTVAACPVPVVTGIGHEPDTTIADMVADVRASTPTGAAETVGPDKASTEERLDRLADRMLAAVERSMERHRVKVDSMATRNVFKDPRSLFTEESLALDHALARMDAGAERFMERTKAPLDACEGRLYRAIPRAVERDVAIVERMAERLERSGTSMLVPFEAKMRMEASRLNDLSPLAVLSRGYAMARDADGAIVKDGRDVSVGDRVDVTLARGVLECSVVAIAEDGLE